MEVELRPSHRKVIQAIDYALNISKVKEMSHMRVQTVIYLLDKNDLRRNASTISQSVFQMSSTGPVSVILQDILQGTSEFLGAVEYANELLEIKDDSISSKHKLKMPPPVPDFGDEDFKDQWAKFEKAMGDNSYDSLNIYELEFLEKIADSLKSQSDRTLLSILLGYPELSELEDKLQGDKLIDIDYEKMFKTSLSDGILDTLVSHEVIDATIDLIKNG